jgi:transposase
MTAPVCPGCCRRDATIADLQQQVAALEQRVRDLEARLGQNAANSSLPPSANPLQAPKPVVKTRTGRQPGGQPGHPPHLKQLLPPEQVTTFQHYLPQHCQHCQAPLPAQAGPHDPPPTRCQTVELPPVTVVVTEYQGHARTCLSCGAVTQAAIPATVRAHSVGPRLTATLSYFSGCHGVSKRGVEEIADHVFGAPVALGTVANLEQEVSAALEPAHQEAQTAVQAAPVKNVDETSWKLAGQLRWLWAAAAARVVVFVIHARRSALGLTALLGLEIQGILCSDRWGVYSSIPNEQRQVCWAHLKRDFQKLVDRGGPAQSVGRAGLKIVTRVFAAWRAFQAGDRTREQLDEQLHPVRRRWGRVLVDGAFCGDATAEQFCHNLLELDDAPFTFARVAGVEPTNNAIERLLRRAVLWRKRSFGCWSEAGCRFVERILTVVQTRRLQGQNVLEYLHDAVLAHRTGLPCPKLVPEG